MKRKKKRTYDVRQEAPAHGANRMNERLAAHLLKRLRREAKALALSDAVDAGILRRESVESHGIALTVYRRCPQAIAGMPSEQAGPSRLSPQDSVSRRHRLFQPPGLRILDWRDHPRIVQDSTP